MALTTLKLTATFTPAYFALMAVAEEIAAKHGEEAALDWVAKAIRLDLSLFCVLSADTKPDLTLIQGGRQ